MLEKCEFISLENLIMTSIGIYIGMEFPFVVAPMAIAYTINKAKKKYYNE